MGIRTLLFIIVFAAVTVGGLIVPMAGVLGYVGHYIIGPERQWWSVPLQPYEIRYSLILAAITAIGMILHFHRLRIGRPFLLKHEKIALLFLLYIVGSMVFGEKTVGLYTVVDHPTIKMLKLMAFAMMLSHVVTTQRRLEALLWTLVIGALLLGLQAYYTPRSAYAAGRLETVGGTDFAESNVLAAFLAAMLPIVGIQFLRSGWIGKVLCLGAGAFAANAIILTRSRGALMGLGAGALTALVFAPPRLRGKIVIGMLGAGIGLYSLMDVGFTNRAASIVVEEGENRDRSAESRLQIWKASVSMLREHPLGVGPGNFAQNIGRYEEQHAGRDAHNTFVRCYSELGLPGLLLFLMLIGSALSLLRQAQVNVKQGPTAEKNNAEYVPFALAISLITLLAAGLTVTLLYVEVLWWLLMVPVCLYRAGQNTQSENSASAKLPDISRGGSAKPAGPKVGRGKKKKKISLASGRLPVICGFFAQVFHQGFPG